MFKSGNGKGGSSGSRRHNDRGSGNSLNPVLKSMQEALASQAARITALEEKSISDDTLIMKLLNERKDSRTLNKELSGKIEELKKQYEMVSSSLGSFQNTVNQWFTRTFDHYQPQIDNCLKKDEVSNWESSAVGSPKNYSDPSQSSPGSSVASTSHMPEAPRMRYYQPSDTRSHISLVTSYMPHSGGNTLDRTLSKSEQQKEIKRLLELMGDQGVGSPS